MERKALFFDIDGTLLSEETGAVMEASCVKLARLTADIIASQFD